MIVRLRKWGASLVLLLTITSLHEPLLAEQHDLRKFLVGKWRQTVHEGMTEIEFRSDGSFTYRLQYRLRGGHPATLVEGKWQILVGNQLRMHNTSWEPTSYRFPNGSTKEIRVDPWTSTTVQVVDADHVRMNGGVSARVPD